MSTEAALDPTLSPAETIRADSAAVRATTTPPLPALSVDLRELSPHPEHRTDLEVRGVIGEGGMGRVLLARQHSLQRDVAVKTSKDSAGPAAHAAILLEGAVTGSLEHPGIVPVHALGLDARGLPVMVMKRIEGVTWEALLADPNHPRWDSWEGSPENRLPGHLQVLLQVCNAVHYAHSRGIVHRDLKPANVLLGSFGDVYVADWGLGTSIGTRQLELCGTPSFLAPEMVTGGPVDERTDVYLLGAMLHVVLTGTPRHEGATVTAAVLAAKESRPATYAPHVPHELAELANRACHREPSQRPPSARAFRDELNRYVKHRDARSLAEQADRRVVELEPLLALDAPGEAERTRLERLLSEARFGLEQALAQWPENEAAQRSLQKVESLLAVRARRLAALENEARELDPRRGHRSRTLGLLGTTLLGLGAAVGSLIENGTKTPLLEDANLQTKVVVYPVLVTMMMGLGALLMRKRLLVSRFNRQVFGLMMSAMVLMCFFRVMALGVPQPVWVQLSRDAAILSAFMTAAAIAFLRWVWPTAVLLVVTALACAAFREHAILVFSWGTSLTLGVTTVLSWWDGRARAGG